jgi:hypothetical protein
MFARRCLYTLLGLLFLLPGGCSPLSAAKAGYTAIKGASARVYPIDAVTRTTLEKYQGIEVGQVSTDLEAVVSDYCVIAVENAFEEAFSKELDVAFAGDGEKKLLANIVVRFFKEKPLVGKEARLDVLVTLVDDQDGEPVAKFYVEGFSNSIRARDADDLARENADEFAEYLLELLGKKEELLG